MLAAIKHSAAEIILCF